MNQHHTKGAAMIFFILLFVMATGALLFAFARNLYLDMYTIGSLSSSKQAYIIAESALEDVVYQMRNRGGALGVYDLQMTLGVATTTVTYDSAREVYVVQARSQTGASRRITTVELRQSPGSSFNYGMQAGNGGFRMTNSSGVVGNVFSNGSIEGQGGSYVTGDAISSGPDGLIDGMEIRGNSWSQTLRNSEVWGHAHYNELLGSNDLNETTTPFEVMDPEPLPISEEEFDEWQTQLEAMATVISASDPQCSGGVYEITVDTELGNTKIECDLRVSGVGGGTELTLTGSLWVVGDVFFGQGSTVITNPSNTSNSVFIIADDPDDRMNKGTIDLRNSTNFLSHEDVEGYIMLVSRNHAISMGGSTVAIEAGQTVEGNYILYTNNGRAVIRNNSDLKSITAYRIDINNSAIVSYEEGLQNVNFTGGPGGTLEIVAWYQE